MNKFETKDMEIEYTFRSIIESDERGVNKYYDINIKKLMVFDEDIGDWVDRTENPRWIEKAEDLLIDAHNEDGY